MKLDAVSKFAALDAKSYGVEAASRAIGSVSAALLAGSTADSMSMVSKFAAYAGIPEMSGVSRFLAASQFEPPAAVAEWRERASTPDFAAPENRAKDTEMCNRIAVQIFVTLVCCGLLAEVALSENQYMKILAWLLGSTGAVSAPGLWSATGRTMDRSSRSAKS